ncbi:MAG: ABC transporter permease [Chloroflexota bacterium]
MSNPSTQKRYLTSPRWLKVFLDIWENRSQTILVVASIAVGVFAVGMIVSTFFIIAQDMESSYSGSNPANIEIITESFDDDFVQITEKLPGVDTAEGRRTASLRISRDNGETWDNLEVIAIDNFEEASIFTRELISGQPIPNDKEILLESRILDAFDIELGEELLIQLSNGTVRQAPVVGFVRDQGVAGGPASDAVAYTTLDTLAWLGEDDSLNQLMVVVDGDRTDEAHIEAVALEVEDRIEKSGRIIFNSVTNRSDEHPGSDTVLAILGILGAMGLLMLILSGSLISNTLTALLNKQMRQIGVMKLVGARNFQVVGMYIVMIIVLSLLSLLISIPLGSWGGYRFSLFLGNLLSITIDDFRIIWVSVIIQVAIAVIIPLISGVSPVLKGARLSVEDAISDNSTGGTQKEGWLDRLGESFDRITRPMLVSIRNTFRNVRRLVLTLFTLTVAGGIFIAVFNVQASLTDFIGSVGNLFIADVSISLDRAYREDRLASYIEPLDGVVYTEGWLGTVGEVETFDGGELILSISGIPSDSTLVQPTLKEGRFLVPGDENAIVLAESIWTEFPDLSAGDTIPLEVAGNREELWTVVGIFAFPGPGDINVIGYAPYDTVARATNQIGRTTVLKVVTSDQSYAEQIAFGEEFDAILQAEGIGISEVEAGKATTESVSDGINTVISMLLGMAILTAIVGSIGLAGTMSMNVTDRIREIGILRAIGAVDRSILGSVLMEGIFIGVLSWLLGIVISFPLSYGLLVMVSLSLTSSIMPLLISTTGFWLWLLVIIVLASLASAIPARNASRLTIREVLAYE